LQRTEALLEGDARSGGRVLGCVVAEMNDPFRPGALDDCFDPFVRARIWEGWGYARLDFPYEQPALSKDQQGVSHLMLAAKPLRADWSDGIPSATVKAALVGYMRWAMRIDAPEATSEFRCAADFMRGSEKVRLTSLDAYVGVSDATPLVTRAIEAGDDANLKRALDVYRAAFPGGPTDIDADGFRRALRGASAKSARYHLWAVRGSDAAQIEGVASFFTFPACGFGGYVALAGSLKGTRRLPLLLARMEEQILRDRLGAAGWFIECEADREALFKTQGFHTVDIEYRQPPLPDRPAADMPVLRLMYKEFGRRFKPPSMTSDAFLTAMRQIFGGVYEIATPETSPAFGHLSAQVKRLPNRLIRFR
jgi:hypothetical protein